MQTRHPLSRPCAPAAALAFVLAASVSLDRAAADTVEIQPAADSSIYKGAPRTNLGAADYFLAGKAPGEPSVRALVRFDVGAGVPAGSTVTGARLSLQATGETADVAAFELRRVLRFWDEGDGSQENGFDAERGAVTWKRNAHPRSRWARGGGARGADYARGVSGTFEVAGPGEAVVESDRMVKDVQRWLDRPGADLGWVISRNPGEPAGGIRRFASREDAALAPVLTVDFTPPSPETLAESANYKVVFRAAWSPESHPRDFPPNAHWSGLVGGLHNHLVSFWERGRPASEGIRRMAELGAQADLLAEVEAAVATGEASHGISGSGINGGTGRSVLQFTVQRTHPLVTLNSMVAPSPDWFVGVRGVPLIEKGQWVQRKSIPLYPYDAGTDNGRTFRSADEVTEPRGNITRIAEPPLGNRRGYVPRIGTFVFVREDS